jgi:acetyl esterase/lipase
MFAARLAAADVDVEFHMFSGVPHGFEAAWNINITKRALEGRIRFMKGL